MGIYEYHCSNCGYDFEEKKPIRERNMVSCPACGAKADKKLSLFNYTFGFRFTDESHIRGNPDEVERNV